MSQEWTLTAGVERDSGPSRMIRDRRDALVALMSMPLAFVTSTSLTAEAGGYPLWIIKARGGSVYLLGHTPPRQQDWSDQKVESLLGTCVALWNETNQTDAVDAQALMQRYGVNPDKPLNAWLTEQDRVRLTQAAKLIGVPENALMWFRPWLAGQALEGAFFSAPGLNARNADSVLGSEAGAKSISVSSEFATKEDAARWFAGLSPEQEVQYLRYILDEILLGHEEGQRIYTAWSTGKAAPAAAWVGQMKQRYPELYRSIVVSRNQNWVPRIETLLTQAKPSMIVVGLYHLVGPDSIQNQLHAKGLDARRI